MKAMLHKSSEKFWRCIYDDSILIDRILHCYIFGSHKTVALSPWEYQTREASEEEEKYWVRSMDGVGISRITFLSGIVLQINFQGLGVRVKLLLG